MVKNLEKDFLKITSFESKYSSDNTSPIDKYSLDKYIASPIDHNTWSPLTRMKEVTNELINWIIKVL